MKNSISSTHLNAAAAEQESDLLWSGVAARERHLDWHGHDAGLEAAVERADEVDGVVVRVDEGDAVAGLQAALADDATQRLVQQRVRDLVRAAEQLAVGQRHAHLAVRVQDRRRWRFVRRRAVPAKGV